MAVTQKTAPVVIIGTGVAGLTAALCLAEHQSVLVLTKTDLQSTNTSLAQGGIACAWSAQDSPASHIKDTLKIGGQINDLEAVTRLCTLGPQAVERLIRFGTQFDQDDQGEYRLALEGAHSIPRVLHAGGDASGLEIQRALSAAALSHPQIQVLEHCRLTEILSDEQGVVGLVYMDLQNIGHRIETNRLILASGGAGRAFQYTANQKTATAETLVLAAQVGAKLTDLEFFQFHPTGLDVPGQANSLISEALRGEGATLVNQKGEPFMLKYHPEGGLAARDVVSRAISAEINQTGRVYLDATQLNHDPIEVRFPHIFRRCLALGVDPRKEGIPVTPVAHYMMGGIVVDLAGRSAVAGLYAVGEVARTGVHGASRLASNSLLEGAVFGAEVAEAIRQDAQKKPACWSEPLAQKRPFPEHRQTASMDLLTFQKAMWSTLGLVREEAGLRSFTSEVQTSLGSLPDPKDQATFELYHMKIFGLLMAQSAQVRQESRGSHYRADFVVTDPNQSRSLVHQFFQPPTFI